MYRSSWLVTFMYTCVLDSRTQNQTSGPQTAHICSSVTDELVAVVRHSPSLTDELYGELPLE